MLHAGTAATTAAQPKSVPAKAPAAVAKTAAPAKKVAQAHLLGAKKPLAKTAVKPRLAMHKAPVKETPAVKPAAKTAVTVRRHFRVAAWQEGHWLAALSSANYHTRLKAKRRFLAAGASAIPFLQHALHKAKTPEVRGVVGRMLETIRLRKLLGATLITLHMKNAPPSRVADAISKQMHATFTYWPPQLWTQQQWTPINFNATREPFWLVMQEFQKKTGVGMATWGNNTGVTLAQVGQSPAPPTFYHGAFMVQATQIQRSSSVQLIANPAKQQAPQRSFSLQLTVYCEPKLCMIQGGPVVLTKARTSTGKSLVDNADPNQNFFYGNSSACQWSSQANLADVRHAGKTIKILRGHWTCLLATRVLTWNVHNILKLKGGAVKRVVDGTAISVQDVKSAGKGQWSVTVVLTNPAGNRQLSFGGPNFQETLINEQSNFLNNAVSLLDAKGNALNSTGTSDNDTNTTMTSTFTFSNATGIPNGAPIPPPGPAAAAAAPATFTLKLPVQFRVVRLPIRFRNLRLP